MTTYEHAMVGVWGALALGLQRRHGWQIVALAGLTAVAPDLDGLSILLGKQCYAAGHRLWGHNLLAAGLGAALLAAALYKTGVLAKAQQSLARRCRAFSGADGSGNSEARPGRVAELTLWVTVGVAAAYSHLLVDVFFSAGRDLPVWGVPLCWPFSDAAWAYPLVPWGDIGATVIFAAAMFAMVRWPARIRAIAAGSLVAAGGYMVLRGVMW
jgi:membrane-bound metal-dependent hydrolase YbcI (DUF457 family)